jgi:hypothetical protein
MVVGEDDAGEGVGAVAQALERAQDRPAAAARAGVHQRHGLVEQQPDLGAQHGHLHDAVGNFKIGVSHQPSAVSTERASRSQRRPRLLIT